MKSTKNPLKKREKRELSPKQKKVMNILNWVATALCIVLVVFSLVVAIFTIASTQDEEFRVPSFGNTTYLVVKSDSMSPTFDKDDMIIAKKYDSSTDGELEIGQIITFRIETGEYNTHRIIRKNYDSNGNLTYSTRGDNSDKHAHTWQEAVEAFADRDIGDTNFKNSYGIDKSVVYPSSILATWGESDGSTVKDGSILKGVGGFTNWIQDEEQGRTRFFCVVVLPLILLFVVYAFVLVRTLVIAKLENERKVQAEQVVTVDSLSDEEKRRLAQEYLASLNQSGADEQADKPVDVEPVEDSLPIDDDTNIE